MNTRARIASQGRTVAIVLVAVLAIVFTIYNIVVVPRVTHGFAMYYTYARMLLEGEEFSHAFEYEYFNARVAAYGMPDVKDMPNNIPTNALVMLPIAWLPPGPARIIWGFVSLLALIASIRILFRAFRIDILGYLGLAVVAFVLLFKPLYDCVAYGQLYLVLLLLFSLAVRGVAYGRWRTSGLAIAAAFLAKGYGVIPLLFLAFMRKWKSFASAIVVICSVIVVTLPVFGLETWKSFYSEVIVRLGTNPSDGHTAYQTVNSLFLHLFSFNDEWLPHPLIVLPGTVLRLMSYLVNMALIAIVFLRSSYTPASDATLSFSASIAVGVISAPLAEEYHFLLCLPLVVGLAAIRFRDNPKKSTWMLDVIFLASLLLLALPFDYKTLNDALFPVILLAYPKLYATLGLLTCFALRSVWCQESESPGEARTSGSGATTVIA